MQCFCYDSVVRVIALLSTISLFVLTLCCLLVCVYCCWVDGEGGYFRKGCVCCVSIKIIITIIAIV